MPTTRRRALTRTDRFVGSRWPRLHARAAGMNGDGGFTMVEMIVALVIISIIMTAFASFFVSTVSATSRQGSSQAAIQLADDAIERVRAMDPTAILTGRDQTSSTAQWNSPVTGVASYESDMSMAYDGAATSGGATATLPTVGSPVVVNGLTYNQNWYIGKCWQPLGGGACTIVGNPTVNTYASFYRVVVAVTWSDTVCASSHCVFIATTLVSNAQYDPQFNSNLVAQPPSVVNPNNQTSDKGVLDSLTLNSSGGAGAITWSATGLPDGITLNGGVLSGTPTALGTFSVVITATDQFSLHGTANFTWTIVAPPVVAAAAQTDEVGVAASYTASCTCTGTITWSAPSLPPGLAINPTTGLMSGNPTTPNTTGTSVTVVATDAQGGTGSAIFNWIVYPAISITTPAAQSSSAGTAITALQVVATGGLAPYTWSTTTGLPAGLSLSSTGKITGTPTAAAAGTKSVTVTASDGLGGTATTTTFTWTVGYTAPTITTPANQVTDVGTAVSLTVSKSGGISPYSWTSSGLSGTGLSVNSSGVITGTPTAAAIGQHTVTVTVTDTYGVSDTTDSFIWTVVAAPVIMTPTNTLGSAKGTAVSVTPLVSGGVGPYTWSATGLPATSTGVLAINSATGVISGTPNTANSYTVVLKVTDANGVVDTQTFTWTVVTTTTSLMNIQPITDQFGIAGTAFAGPTPTFVGGPTSGTITWSATGLPSWLSISSSTGKLTGTPPTTITTTTAYTVTVKVARGSSSDTQVVTVTIYPTAPSITSPSSTQQSTHGVAITPIGAVATGGSGTLTWSVSAGSLPPGITISTWGVLSGTPTTVNTTGTSVTLKATDPLTGASDTQTFTWKVT